LIGLYALLLSLAMMSHKQASVEAVTAMVESPALLLLAGFIGLGLGLALVLGHNVWSGSLAAALVSLLGWIFLVRSLMVLFLPGMVERIFSAVHYERYFYLYMSVPLLIGLYLTYCGFRKISA